MTINRILMSLVFICALTHKASCMEENQHNKMQGAPIKKAGPQSERKRKAQHPAEDLHYKKPKHDRQSQADDIVTVRGCDSNHDFKVTRQRACLSQTLFNVIQDEGIDNHIPLPGVTARQLKLFIIPAWEEIDTLNKYCMHQQQCVATPHEIKTQIINSWKNNNMQLDDLVELINNANYLDSKVILEATYDYFIELLEQQVSLDGVKALQKSLSEKKVPKTIQSNIATAYLKKKGYYGLQKTLTACDKDWITLVDITPDNNFIVCALYMKKSIKIFDVKTEQCIQTLVGHEGEIDSITITADSNLIITGSYDTTIKIWELKTGNCIQTLTGHESRVNSVKMTPDGKYIISASADNTIKIWELKTGNCIQTLVGHTDFICSVIITPNSKNIISSSYDDTSKIWDIETGTCIQTCLGHKWWAAFSITLTPNGKQIIAGSLDKTIKIWDIETGTCIKTLRGHTKNVRYVIITPDGKNIISGSDDKTIKIWDIETDTCIKTLCGHTEDVRHITITPDGKYIISASSDEIKIWNIETGTCIQTFEIGHSQFIIPIIITPHCNAIISGSIDQINIYSQTLLNTTSFIEQAWLITHPNNN